MNDKHSLFVLAMVVIVMGMVLISTGRASETDQYCEMRQIWKETSGEFGWPNFDNNREEACE